MQNPKKKLYNWTYLQKKNRQRDLENELMVTSGEGWEEGIISEPGMNRYTLLYFKMESQQGPTV